MAHDELAAASEILAAAADDIDDEEARSELLEHADHLSRLAASERGPDHGRLDRHQNALHHIGDRVSESVAARLREANARINNYRETVEGV